MVGSPPPPLRPLSAVLLYYVYYAWARVAQTHDQLEDARRATRRFSTVGAPAPPLASDVKSYGYPLCTGNSLCHKIPKSPVPPCAISFSTYSFSGAKIKASRAEGSQLCGPW